MVFKDSTPRFQLLELALLDADPAHVRQGISEESLKGLVNAISRLGVIHPLVVRPLADGRYQVIVGERRRQAALLAGEQVVPVVIRECSDEDALSVRVFENIGLGVRSALEPRDMANAIQGISARFASPDEAAQFFGRAPTWLAQATAAANLSEKVTALLDSGKISSTSAAIQLEKLSRKNEAKAESLIEQIEQLPEGEKVSKKVVDEVLLAESGRSKKPEVEAEASPAPAAVSPAPLPASAAPTPEAAPASPAPEPEMVPPWEAAAPAETRPTPSAPPRERINPGKIKLVAELLGLSEDDEEELLVRLIDEFLALKGA